MDLFHLLQSDKKRVAPPVSPERPRLLLHRERRSKNSNTSVDIPDLVENESVTSSSEATNSTVSVLVIMALREVE